MNFIALLKRVLPFFAGLAIGLIPSWIFTGTSTLVSNSFQPAFVTSRTYCDKSFKSSKKFVRTEERRKLQINSKPTPGYTEAARENSIEGNVVLRVTFKASGEIGTVTPVKSLAYGLTEQAIDAAKRIEFEPAMEGSRPVTVVKQINYTFSLL